MKLGIITIIDHTNYGNRLQNYAIWYLLHKKLGHEATTLTTVDEKRFNNGNFLLWLKERTAGLLCRLTPLAEQHFGPQMTRWANFQSWSRQIPTKIYYKCRSLPQSVNEEYDLFLAGSDQIWNYQLSASRFDDFFLRFALPHKKAALCGSFGVEDLPEVWKPAYVQALSGFRHISVREDAGREIISHLLGREVPVLIDPVMMLSPEEWDAVSRPPRLACQKPYVLKYHLGSGGGTEVLDTWAKEQGYAVYDLMDPGQPDLYSAGPGEFLALLRRAALVCTDSFHGAAFSILFSRPFAVCPRQGPENNMTSRLTTLLNKFGFQDRWLHLLKPEEYLLCDFTHVPQLLNAEQVKFMNYLNCVLGER